MTSDEIFIDLSKCQFAELGALAQLLLIIESFLNKQHTLYLALPTTRNTEREKLSDFDKIQKDSNLKKRKNTTSFLKKSGFVSAVQEISKIYETEIYITEDYDFQKSTEEINLKSFMNSFSIIYEEIIVNDENYKFLLPFKWIDCQGSLGGMFDFEANLNKILENSERGLDNIDIKVIKNVVLSELIKNVRVHSKSKYAIFAIGLIKSSSIIENRYLKKFNPIEQEHINYIKNNKIESQVEIFFGDSGVGILNKDYQNYINNTFGANTKLERQLEYAFNKWTSLQDDLPRRGTKGLYRLKRIVDKYKGLVHIKTDNFNGGFFNDKYQCRTLNAAFIGTLISVRLNPFKEIKAFNLSSIKKENKQNWNSNKYVLTSDLSCLDQIKRNILAGENLLVILDISSIDLSKESQILESFLYELSFISHPSAIVLYLINKNSIFENDTLDLIVESVQTRIIKTQGDIINPEINVNDFEEVHDPVLVIGNNNQTFWYGGSKELISIIDESYKLLGTSNQKIITLLDSFKGLEESEQIDIKTYLQNSSNLVVLNEQNEIEFDFYGIENHYENKILNFKPNYETNLVCSPRLQVLNNWINISKLLENDEYGFALCLYIKYRRFIEESNLKVNELDNKNLFVLIDHFQQYELTKKFAELLGIKNKNIRNIESEIDYNIPKRTKLFNENSNVIFLTTIISSSETIRRMVKYAKRDLANPEVILCLLNFRKYSVDELETWNDKTKIISIFKKNIFNLQKEDKNEEFFKDKLTQLNSVAKLIDPDYNEAKITNDNEIKIESEILNFIKQNKFLHYNHYGFYNKRHFTFFLDKKGILNKDSFIWAEIYLAIDEWIKRKNIIDYTIYINSTLIENNSPFILSLNKKYSNRVRLLNSKYLNINSVNSVYFDFGVLTGESINKIISSISDVNNLFICLLFNQSINSNANIYKKIENLHYQQNINAFETEKRLTSFEIKYLYRLPLSFFNSETCPICEHRRALDFYKIDNQYITLFSNDRRERLKQNFIEDIYETKYPVDFYYTENEKKQELSTEIVFQMYELKVMFENAIKLTKNRIEIYNLIYHLYNNLYSEIKNSESKIYSLLYYLSHEINWFQQEPLVFRDFRILISKIALKVAVTDIDELISYFSESNKYEIENKSLATRYKYAAISILRSSDKLLFCKSISDIIASSLSNNICSNNLLQNTLYHISSLFKNSYNKSELYYIEIDRNLNNIIEENIIIDSIQIGAIEYVLLENKIILNSFSNIPEEPILFKEMKEKWEGIYNIDMPRHPEPYQELKALSLVQHEMTSEAIKVDTKLISEKSILLDVINDLSIHSKNLEHFITNNISFYLKGKLELLTNSKYFKNEYNNSLKTDDVTLKFSDINGLIDFFKADPINYLDKRLEYNEMFNYFHDNYIKRRNLGGSVDDSRFFDLISDFPCNIDSIIDDTFTLNDFPKRSVTFQYKDIIIDYGRNIKIYFPKSVLRRHLNFIKDNIFQKINFGANVYDLNLQFNIRISDNKYVEFDISYDLTDQWSKKEKTNGSLKSFKTNIEDFGGSFKYELPGQNNGFFNINIKFLRYE